MSIPKIGLIVSVCLLVIGAIFMTRGGSGGGTLVVSNNVGLVCTNPECGHKEAVDRMKFVEMVKQKEKELGITDEDLAMGRGRGVGTQIPLTCPKCGKDAFVSGNFCDKCQEIFPAQEGQYRDKCPKCGYSRLEEIQKNLKR
jgi:hypothetical protein